MKKQAELINILKAELTLLTQDILQNIHQDDFNDLYKSTRKLYEKMAAIKQLKNRISKAEMLDMISEKQVLTDTPESKQNTVNIEVEEKANTPESLIDEKPEVQEKEPEVIEPETSKSGMGMFKDVSKMRFKPKSKTIEEKTEVVPEPTPEPVQQSVKKAVEKTPITPNKKVKNMSIGLNDRIAFINNLFDGDSFAYTQYIDKLNAFDDYESALRYINDQIKPYYNNWQDKDEYEFRFIQLLELKFN